MPPNDYPVPPNPPAYHENAIRRAGGSVGKFVPSLVCMDFMTAGRTEGLRHDVRKKTPFLVSNLITEIIDVSKKKKTR